MRQSIGPKSGLGFERVRRPNKKLESGDVRSLRFAAKNGRSRDCCQY
jgi:hypothetical protein